MKALLPALLFLLAALECRAGTLHELTSKSFDSILASADDSVLITFVAPWCAHCKQFAPILAQVARENDAVRFAQCDGMFHLRSATVGAGCCD